MGIIGMNCKKMRRFFILASCMIISGIEVNAQRFEGYHYLPRETQHSFRYYNSWGLKVLDDTGEELRRTEPIYRWVSYADGFNRAAVGFPLISLEQGEEVGFERGYVWVCLDYNLKPVFTFPPNTHHIYRIINGMFLYKDKMEHSSTVGLVDRDGTVIFMAPYDKIRIEDDLYVGVKNLTEQNDYSGYEVWAVEFRNASTNFISIYKLNVPEHNSLGLRYDLDDDLNDDWDAEEDSKWFEELLEKDTFQRGLNHFVHARKKEALECFKEALNSKDSKVVACAKHNIDTIEGFNL